jgi:hypothetical protein
LLTMHGHRNLKLIGVTSPYVLCFLPVEYLRKIETCDYNIQYLFIMSTNIKVI